MRTLTRSPCPTALSSGDGPAGERVRAIAHFEGGKHDGFKFELYADKAVRRALAGMSGGKCAYCEAYYDATQPQDVEHYRPKGRIDTAAGKRKPGYWWLASSWDNLLPSCIHCNREQEHTLHDGTTLKTGKGDRFPLVDETHRAKVRGGEVHEVPLLIDPCKDDPAAYLVFVEEDGNSIVKPRSADPTSIAYRRARASIDIYGLNRVGLVHLRSRALKRVRQSLKLIETVVGLIETAQPLQRDSLERLFLEEVEMIRAHATGRDGFAAVAAPLARETFKTLGLRF